MPQDLYPTYLRRCHSKGRTQCGGQHSGRINTHAKWPRHIYRPAPADSVQFLCWRAVGKPRLDVVPPSDRTWTALAERIQLRNSDAVVDAKNEIACRLVAVKVACICMLARRAAETEMQGATTIDFSNMLELCEEVDGFLEAGCLNFGLDSMVNFLRTLMYEFLYYAEQVSEHPHGLRDERAKSDLRQSITLCYDALGMSQPRIH